MLKILLNSPVIYQSFQKAGGFFGARVKAIAEFLAIDPGVSILDIGCGPGYICSYMPTNVNYVGYDIDQAYIDHANAKFGKRARFYCRLFDASAAHELYPVDIVMMNGVLHHISDAELAGMLSNVRSVLRPGGTLFSLDGCYCTGQSAFRKWMLDNDRGDFVRDEAGYRAILRNVFEDVELHVREEYSRIPYTFVVGLSRKAPLRAPEI
jgi:cyclopropane fatty-acyl-phospholipid synthase-like methyltransferase